jgi:hypothetical protein
MRKSALEKVMEKLHTQDNVKGSFIAGYETLSSVTSKKRKNQIDLTADDDPDNETTAVISDHPGFKRMVHLMNEHPDELRSWMRSGETPRTGRNGLLWNHVEERDPRRMPRAQLIERLEQLELKAKELEEIKTINEALTAVHTRQEGEIANLNTELEIEKQMAAYHKISLEKKQQECEALQKRVDELTAAVATIGSRWPVEERPVRCAAPCPACDRLTLVRYAPRFYTGPVSIRCTADDCHEPLEENLYAHYVRVLADAHGGAA